MRITLGIPATKEMINWQLAQTLKWFQTDYILNWIEGAPNQYTDGRPKVSFNEHFVGQVDVNYGHNLLLWYAMYPANSDWLVICGYDQWAVRIDEFSYMVQMLAYGDMKKAAIIGAPVALSNSKSYNVSIKAGEMYGPFLKHKDPFPVERIGSGFTAYNCNWFRNQQSRNPPVEWFRSVTEKFSPTQMPNRFGLDYFICDEVRSRGGSIFCDPRMQISHERTWDLSNDFGRFAFDHNSQKFELLQGYQSRFVPAFITGESTPEGK